MTPHQLRVFISVAKHRSFTQAARELYVSQSAISHELKRLQKTLGVALIERGPRGIELTPTGAALRTDAALILAQLDGLETKYGAVISQTIARGCRTRGKLRHNRSPFAFADSAV
jgi:DNA-binding transcriptional LysR family regulator